MAASIVLLAACSGLEQPEQDLFMNNGEDLVEKVIFEVLPVKDGDDPETKASAVPNGGTVGFVWEATDTVGIYPDKGSQVYFNIEDGVGTSSVSFTGGGWALKQNSTYCNRGEHIRAWGVTILIQHSEYDHQRECHPACGNIHEDVIDN